jgi:hypothetical protein
LLRWIYHPISTFPHKDINVADEFTIRVGLTARGGNVDYVSRPDSYTADLEGATMKGPTPGAVAVSTEGTDIDLTQLTNPGYCRIRNIDTVNSFEWGVYDPENDRFIVVGELAPGEPALFRLSRNFGQEYTDTGTGTTAATNTLRCKALGGASVALVEAFQR